jgi:hypothetical protein
LFSLGSGLDIKLGLKFGSSSSNFGSCDAKLGLDSEAYLSTILIACRFVIDK